MKNFKEIKTTFLGIIATLATLYYWFIHPIIMKKFELPVTETNYWAIVGGFVGAILLFAAPDKIIDIVTQFMKGIVNRVSGGSNKPNDTIDNNINTP